MAPFMARASRAVASLRDSDAGGLIPGPELQVLGPVVRLHAVDVMHVLTRTYFPVLTEIVLRARHVSWRMPSLDQLTLTSPPFPANGNTLGEVVSM